jgi:hypothetical protein
VIWQPEFPSADDDADWRIASGESELATLLKEILRSGFVRSVIESMFAEAAEQESDAPTDRPNDPTTHT